MINIDFREKDLIELATRQGILNSICFIDSKMKNGDITLAVSESNNVEACMPILILERKKVSDFRASLSDGRMNEQRFVSGYLCHS